MKKLVTALVAAAMLSGPVLAAPHHDDHRPGAKKVVVHKTVTYRNWKRGERFDNRYARNYRVIDNRRYKLKAPPRGYRWVQSGNDAVLIGITSGIVASVIANAVR